MQSLNQMEIDPLVFFARRREMETFQDSRVKTDGFIIRDLQEEIRSYFHLKEHVSLDRVSLVTNFMITKSSVSSDHYTYTLPEKFRYLIKPHKAIGDAARMFLVDREFHQFPEGIRGAPEGTSRGIPAQERSRKICSVENMLRTIARCTRSGLRSLTAAVSPEGIWQVKALGAISR